MQLLTTKTAKLSRSMNKWLQSCYRCWRKNVASSISKFEIPRQHSVQNYKCLAMNAHDDIAVIIQYRLLAGKQCKLWSTIWKMQPSNRFKLHLANKTIKRIKVNVDVWSQCNLQKWNPHNLAKATFSFAAMLPTCLKVKTRKHIHVKSLIRHSLCIKAMSLLCKM